MKSSGTILCFAVGVLLAASLAFSQDETHQGQGQVVVTVLPKHDSASPASVAVPDMGVKVNGKQAKITTWKPLQGPADGVELVILIDGSARGSLGTQLDEITHFVKSLPPNTKSAIAYMQNGRALFAGPLTTDHAQVLRALHLPDGSAGSDGSPYFCLSDLVKHWPSTDRTVRREVLMVTDGVDNYNPRYDPEDPYVQAAIDDTVRAGVVLYSIYWQSQGRFANSLYQMNSGQNHLNEVAEATGGKNFWQGSGNPVSFEPYFDELSRRLRNQYELGFTSSLKGKSDVEPLKLKLSEPGMEINAPQRVVVYPQTAEQK
jgi:hypothetical protein